MCRNVLPACIYAHHIGLLDLLELESGMAVSHHVGSGNKTRVLCKSSRCSLALCPLSSPISFEKNSLAVVSESFVQNEENMTSWN